MSEALRIKEELLVRFEIIMDGLEETKEAAKPIAKTAQRVTRAKSSRKAGSNRVQVTYRQLCKLRKREQDMLDRYDKNGWTKDRCHKVHEQLRDFLTDVIARYKQQFADLL